MFISILPLLSIIDIDWPFLHIISGLLSLFSKSTINGTSLKLPLIGKPEQDDSFEFKQCKLLFLINNFSSYPSWSISPRDRASSTSSSCSRLLKKPKGLDVLFNNSSLYIEKNN